MIITQEKYNGDFIHRRFAYEQFRKEVSPVGNIVAFRAPMDVKENLIDLEDTLTENGEEDIGADIAPKDGAEEEV